MSEPRSANGFIDPSPERDISSSTIIKLATEFLPTVFNSIFGTAGQRRLALNVGTVLQRSANTIDRLTGRLAESRAVVRKLEQELEESRQREDALKQAVDIQRRRAESNAASVEKAIAALGGISLSQLLGEKSSVSVLISRGRPIEASFMGGPSPFRVPVQFSAGRRAQAYYTPVNEVKG